MKEWVEWLLAAGVLAVLAAQVAATSRPRDDRIGVQRVIARQMLRVECHRGRMCRTRQISVSACE